MDAVVVDGFTFLLRETGLAPAIHYRPGSTQLLAVRPGPNLATGAGAIILGSSKLDAELFRERRGPAAVQGLVAHEFGHIVQFSRTTTHFARPYHCELHADFLAGYFLGRSVAGDGPPAGINDLMTALAAIADHVDEAADAADRTAGLVHGTRAQRRAAALLGYQARSQPSPQAYDLGERVILTLADSFHNAVPQIRRIRRVDHDPAAAAWLRVVSERTLWGHDTGLPRATTVATYETPAPSRSSFGSTWRASSWTGRAPGPGD
ncbi:MAG TPA: hypothetical protein VEQ60_14570 [Longimicrobium sp.]|nr:hypothetical protein [Longimicrobium sp.]